MRTFARLLLTLMGCALVGASVYIAVDTETRAARWQQRVNSAESIEATNLMILRSQDYSNLLMESLRVMANENGLLCERDAKAMDVMLALEEANAKLKAALAEATNLMQGQLAENDRLMEELDRAYYRIMLLERTVDSLTPQPTPADDLDDIKDDLLDIFTPQP